MNNPAPSYILTVVCPDKVGIVAAVAGYLTSRNWFIEESSHFGDRDTGTFFMRTRFTVAEEGFSRTSFASVREGRRGFDCGFLVRGIFYPAACKS